MCQFNEILLLLSKKNVKSTFKSFYFLEPSGKRKVFSFKILNQIGRKNEKFFTLIDSKNANTGSFKKENNKDLLLRLFEIKELKVTYFCVFVFELSLLPIKFFFFLIFKMVAIFGSMVFRIVK